MTENPQIQWQEQIDWKPRIENDDNLRSYPQAIVCGMGGSQLGALVLQTYASAPLILHRDYGLPQIITPETLIIASSYSGTTEETIDAAQTALARKLPLAIIASGGPLLTLAQENNVPYIVLPNLGLEPRYALILSMRAIATLMKDTSLEEKIRSAAESINHAGEREAGEKLASFLQGHTPVLYATSRHEALAYIWKIKLNETAKSHAFVGMIPEMCHNELEAYDTNQALAETRTSSAAVFIADNADHPRSLTRMKVASELLLKSGCPCEGIWLVDSSLESVFRSIAQADWASTSLAHMYGVEAATTPLIRAFKERMTQES